MVKTARWILAILAPAVSSSQEFVWHRSLGSEGVSVSNIVFFHEHPDSMYAAGPTALLASPDRGMHWDSIAPGICCGVIEVDALNVQRLLLNETGVPFKGNAIHESTDRGSTWTMIDVGHCTKLKGCATPFFARDPSNPHVLYSILNPVSVIRSTDDGHLWDTLPSPLELNLQSFQVSSDGEVLYAAYGKPIRIFRSSDGGASWVEKGSPVPGTESNIVITVAPDNADLLYAGVTNHGLFRSTDGGTNWTSTGNGLPDDIGEIFSILVNPLNSSDIFVGMGDDDPFDGKSDLVYVSVNNGDEWSPLTQGLPHHGAAAWLSIDPEQFRLFAAVSSSYDQSDSSGIYVFESTTGIEPFDGSVTSRLFLLGQNYPNPFNAASNIEIWLAIPAEVSLRIYNILGEEVEVLIDGYLPKGKHMRVWDASGMPGGVYFCRLESVGSVQVRRMVVLK
jgi:photosystem II stability/assembly factor-like uncharacterized protein